jgi:hypothetical protein
MDAHAHGDRHPDAGDLLDHLEVDLVGLAAAPVQLGIGQGEQAELAAGAEGLRGEAAGPLEGVDLGGEFLAAYVPGHLDELTGLLRGHQASSRHTVEDSRTSTYPAGPQSPASPPFPGNVSA